MEVEKPWEDIEAEAEETEVALRGRLPRHHATADDGPAIITTSKDDVDDKDTSSDESRSSSDDEEGTNGNGNGNGVSHAENGNGNGNGDAKATNGDGHSGIDDRYVDFLVPEENPVDYQKPNLEFEANDSALSRKNGVVIVEVNRRNGGEIEKVEDLPLPDNENGGHETLEYMEARLRKKIEEEFKELYLNKLSDSPGKHEFYCPNCKACITKVLVRERELELETSRVAGFRCTSCFSFLIPIGNWLFPKWSVDEAEEPVHDVPVSFGGLREPLLDQSSQAVTGKTPVPGVVASVTTTIQPLEHNSEHIPSRDLIVQVHDSDAQVASREIPALKQPVVTSVTATISKPTEPVQPRPWSALLFGAMSRAANKSRMPVHEEPIGVIVPETTKPSQVDTDEIGQVQEQVQSSDSNGIGTPHDHQLPVREIAGTVVSAAITPVGGSFETGVKLEVSLPSHDLKGSLPDKITPELDQSNEDVLIVTRKPSESKIEVVAVSSTGELPMLQEVIVHGGSKPSVADSASEEIPQTSTITLGTRDTSLVLETGVPKSWEIVKSIVYGGLVESITSLGIVTSAASGDATTLNIVALALANLIGGLFVVAHNIWELRDDQSTVSSSIYNRMVDKYQELLGRRENFVLHATSAILSFIVFGLVPPVVYGLTFQGSNNKDLKLAAVGAASLVCIVMLAIGKAYIQRPNKYIKTIVYYLVIGFGVSGASYLAGELISKLLKKIESSDSTSALELLLSGTGKSNPAWGSF